MMIIGVRRAAQPNSTLTAGTRARGREEAEMMHFKAQNCAFCANSLKDELTFEVYNPLIRRLAGIRSRGSRTHNRTDW
jgi:hypothetical protein